jgi:hypothetical protein
MTYLMLFLVDTAKSTKTNIGLSLYTNIQELSLISILMFPQEEVTLESYFG